MYYSKGLLIVISGPSGVGKGTVCRELVKQNTTDIEISVSATTRKPRDGEIQGVSYHFKSKNEFEDMIKLEQFLEYAKVYDNYYGTPKAYVMDRLKKGNDIVLEIDTQGAMQVKRNFPEGIFIFIMPPSFEELKRRIIDRGTETKEDIKKRLRSTYEEVKLARNYDYVVFNDEVSSAVEKIYSIISAEKCRVNRYSFDFIGFKEEL